MANATLHKVGIGFYIISAIGLCISLGLAWNYNQTESGVNTGDASFYVPCIARVLGFFIAILSIITSFKLRDAYEKAKFISLVPFIASTFGLIAITLMDPATEESFGPESSSKLDVIKYMTIVFAIISFIASIIMMVTVRK